MADENKLILLMTETGELITTRRINGGKDPSYVTTDKAANVYLCYSDADEVSVFTHDLNEERTLLTKRDGLGYGPFVIVYDEARMQLILSYCGSQNRIDSFQLS